MSTLHRELHLYNCKGMLTLHREPVHQNYTDFVEGDVPHLDAP